MEKMELHVMSDADTITILEGNAPEPLPLREPNKIAITGDIHSVANFIKDRNSGHSSQAIDKNKAIVTVDKDNRTILLQLDPENFYGATVLAKLEQSKELSQFGINAKKMFDRKQLLELLRFNRLYFEDKNQHAQVLLGLSKLRIKSETEIKQEKDNQGNKSNLHDVKTVDDGGLVKEFNITVPIFKGFKAENIRVELCFDVVNGSVEFWLESVGLTELINSSIDGIIETELQACEGFVIIHK